MKAGSSVDRDNGRFLANVSYSPGSGPSEIEEKLTEERAVQRDWELRDDIVAAASNCPVPDCNSLVIEYRAAGNVRPGHPEDWGFTCPRCGVEFTAAQGELIFQSVPKQWLSANAHSA